MLRIPCPHAVVAAIPTRTRVDTLVASKYTTTFWRKAYECSIYLVTAPIPTVAVGDDFSGLNLLPPRTRRPPGRPRKIRIRSRGEFEGTQPSLFRVCGRCGGFGHNRATCKMPI
ncbi:uncharacterized protein LOC112084496 [Eutrema salsugineum]|uniref:uncharacterized protein LOC112084496 n=1 Tax=Eutrema salsugineum TaxID=72664 RepID=UPI000CED34A1|nr:uncharacterized protein LOC112084496 [Eutrema salsugineum]